MALGSTIGSVAGGIGGMALGLPPQVGAAVGGAIGGLGDSIAAKAKKKKAEGMLPEMVDPMEANRYNELKLREKQLMTGTAFQTALGENRKTQAATIAGVNQASGGAGGAAIAAMLRADALAGRTNNETLGKGLEQNNFLSQEMSALATRIAQRKFALQKQKYQQGMYDAAAAQGEANSDLKAQAARTNYKAITDMLGKKGDRGEDGGGGAVVGGANSPFTQQSLDRIGTPLTFGQQPNGMNFPTGIGSVQPQGVFVGNGATPNFSWNQPSPPFNTNGLGLIGGQNIIPPVNKGINNPYPALNFKPITPIFSGGATQVAPTPVQPAPQTVAPPQSSNVISQQPQVAPQKQVVTPNTNTVTPQNQGVPPSKNITPQQQAQSQVNQNNDNAHINTTFDFEDANGYDNFGFTHSNEFVTPEEYGKFKGMTKEQKKAYATELYKQKYEPIVKDLPMPLKIVAGDFNFNSENPYPSLMVSAGLIDVDAKRALYTKENGKTLRNYKVSDADKKAIIDAYNKDPKGFLDKFDAERKRSLAGSTGATKENIEEWNKRVDKTRESANNVLSKK